MRLVQKLTKTFIEYIRYIFKWVCRYAFKLNFWNNYLYISNKFRYMFAILYRKYNFRSILFYEQSTIFVYNTFFETLLAICSYLLPVLCSNIQYYGFFFVYVFCDLRHIYIKIFFYVNTNIFVRNFVNNKLFSKVFEQNKNFFII